MFAFVKCWLYTSQHTHTQNIVIRDYFSSLRYIEHSDVSSHWLITWMFTRLLCPFFHLSQPISSGDATFFGSIYQTVFAIAKQKRRVRIQHNITLIQSMMRYKKEGGKIIKIKVKTEKKTLSKHHFMSLKNLISVGMDRSFRNSIVEFSTRPNISIVSWQYWKLLGSKD